MYNEKYDDYIRSILGYPKNNKVDSLNNNDYDTHINNKNIVNMELEKNYPEIYKIVYPMITKKCQDLNFDITIEEIENITNEIYYAVEENREIELNINLTNEARTQQMNSRINEKSIDRKNVLNKSEENNKRQRILNTQLRDLIKILLIRELLNKPGRVPQQYMTRPGIRPIYTNKQIFNRMNPISNFKDMNDIFEI